MPRSKASGKLAQLHEKIAAIREEMRSVRAAMPPEPVKDYGFQTPDGATKLSQLFGRKHDLIMVHNMGKSCAYCTMWADGYNGVYPHLADRAAFVLSSPDAPRVQKTFAEGRGWRFPMVSHANTSFARDMGYASEDGGCLPGISAFRRDGAKILRITNSPSGPGDDFCSVWHFLDLLSGGAGDWHPKFKYK